ncbi:NAD(P)/FAD-dependent oxidoreductase [Oscillatoria sp. CS-180]|uniref:phytoene desaturase family protein n=1 Tax=Oscillatoria sp. CS-180 TaxID=3021720 RepID=UPI00233027FC|nr:NAD(P)/FAD-dependent oxidoreductase [Oscillatoria sp. CS-180]MDB9524407.1 NAD(P)/FAD-dependent oxidoreductase [Oscillatoria sp. CS-180]
MSADVVVVGSGIGGLSCGALLARYGLNVVVCESHTIPGGSAHGFERDGFRFDSGPSLYSGLSYSPSANPLRQVLDAIGEDAEWKTYDTWGCCLPEGTFNTEVGADQFCEVLATLRGEAAIAEWRQLQTLMKPYGEAAIALPPAAVRFDWGFFQTVSPYALSMLGHAPRLFDLTGPFSTLMNRVVQDPFLRNWLDLLCFLLSGLPASGTSAAEMAFMFADWYRPGVKLDYPVGGSGALVNALVRGLKKWGGSLRLGTHVEAILMTNGRATGVRLKSGEVLSAKRAVVSNASIWDTLRLLPNQSAAHSFQRERQSIPTCNSFMHLHLGIDGADLPPDLACHHIVVNDWDAGVTAAQNVVLISIPSRLDSTIAPPGKETIHVYTPGNEPYSYWQGLKRQSDEYQMLKTQRSQVMWQALERVIPDVRDRVEVELVGTPLTHERFLRRYQGSYGPAIAAGQGLFPGPTTPIDGLLCCGDSTFPGIGLPAVAASGLITANTLVPVKDHRKLMQDIGLR